MSHPQIDDMEEKHTDACECAECLGTRHIEKEYAPMPNGLHKEIIHHCMGLTWRDELMQFDVLKYNSQVNPGQSFLVRAVIVCGANVFVEALDFVRLQIGNKIYLDVPAQPYIEVALDREISEAVVKEKGQPITHIVTMYPSLAFRFFCRLNKPLLISSQQHFQLEAGIFPRSTLRPYSRACLALEGDLIRPVV